MPMSAPGSFSHVTFPSPGRPVPAAPQQSPSLRQRSPLTRQPLAGWQTLTPVGPNGAHSRLQHSLQAPQVSPSSPVQYVPPPAGRPQTPSFAPAAIVQTPPQQSPAFVHASPVWMQNDAASLQ
jgi:hypothetical protein